MRKLNILNICDAIIHQAGGAFISPFRFASILKKRGHHVVFLAAKYPGTKEIDYYDGIKIYRFRSFPLPKFEKLIRISFPKTKEIDEIIEKEKIDIIHIMVPTPAALSSLKSAKKHGLKVVSHSHTQPENILIHLPKFLQNKFVCNLIYSYLGSIYNRTETTICPSKFSEKLLLENNIKSNTEVISNGVDISKFKKINPAPFIKKYKLNPKHKRVLFVGRMHPEKSVETLVKSIPYIIKEFDNFHIDIVGRGYLLDSLKALAKKLGVLDRITFFGKVSDKDLLFAYNACDVFVLPSLAELEGMVVLEAMACGKPIIIANSKQSASIYFVDKNGLLFESGNEKDLANKILKLLKNDKLRKKMGENSYKMSKEYDINKSVDKLEKVYCVVLKDKK